MESWCQLWLMANRKMVKKKKKRRTMRRPTPIEILLAVTLLTAIPLVMVAVELQVHLARLAQATVGAQMKIGVNGNHEERILQNQKVNRPQGQRHTL